MNTDSLKQALEFLDKCRSNRRLTALKAAENWVESASRDSIAINDRDATIRRLVGEANVMVRWIKSASELLTEDTEHSKQVIRLVRSGDTLVINSLLEKK